MPTPLCDIELLLLDVDGVLTDSSIVYTDAGEQIKSFNSKDGLGLRLLMDTGIGVGIITGRSSKALEHRCQNLGITLVFDGIKDKARALDTISELTGISPTKMAYVGDDLIDLPVLTRVGLSCCVADAASEVKTHCDIITRSRGGQGAVREICESILKAKGLWHRIVDSFLS